MHEPRTGCINETYFEIQVGVGQAGQFRVHAFLNSSVPAQI